MKRRSAFEVLREELLFFKSPKALETIDTERVDDCLSSIALANTSIDLVLGRIRVFAKDRQLTAEQVERIFEMGSAAYQVSFGLPARDQSADRLDVR